MTTFRDLLSLAEASGREALLDRSLAEVLPAEPPVRRWLKEQLQEVRQEFGDEALFSFLQHADDSFSGRDLRALRAALLDSISAAMTRPAPAGPRAAPKRPTDPAAIESWAKERGVAWLLRRSVESALGAGLFGIYGGWVPSNVSRSDVIAVLGAPRFSDPRSSSEDRALVDALWRRLEEEAALARAALELEARLALSDRPLPDADPERRDLVAELRAVRARLRARVGPPAPDALPSELLLHEGRDLQVSSSDRLRHTTRLVFARSGPELSCHCAFDRETLCEHGLALVDAVLAQLLLPSKDDGFERALLSGWRAPRWRRTLARVSSFHGARREEVRPPPRVYWLLEEADDDPAARVVPLVQEEGKRGWKKPRRVSAAKLLESDEIELAREDREIAELLAVESDVRRMLRRHDVLLLQVIRRLAGHPRLVLSADDLEPAAIEPGRLETVALGEGDGIRFMARLNGRLLELDELGAIYDRSAIGGTIVELEREARRCVLTPAPSRLIETLATFAEIDEPIPLSAKDEVVRSLTAIGGELPASFEGTLAFPEVPPEPSIVLRLRPGPIGGLEVEVRLRPLARGPLVPPGEGPALLVEADAEREVRATRRELDGEARIVRERLAPILPAIEGCGRSWTLQLEGLEPALALVRALQSASDLVVEWPEQKAWRVTAAAEPKDLALAISARQDWFQVEGAVSVEGHRVDLAVLLEAGRQKSGYVRAEGDTWIAIGGELERWIAGAEPLLSKSRGRLEVPPPLAPEIDRLASEAGKIDRPPSWGALLERIARAEALSPEPPASLRGVLRPYQVEGHAWLMRLAAWGAGACLADDMGLGKTLQAIAALLDRRSEGPALVVAPTSVTYNWIRELERFGPELEARVYRGPGRERLLEGLGPGMVVVTSYGLLARDVDRIASLELATLVLDEAQAIKNASAQRAKAIQRVRAGWRIALTGTPMENHLGELWSIFHAIEPALLGGWEQFRERFAAPIERARDRSRAEALGRLIRPFVLRRTKARVAPELPPRTEIKVDVELSAKERALYEDARLAALARLGELASGVELGEQRFHVLAALTRLRQLACHPRLDDETSRVASSKLERFLELVRGMLAGGQRALVFSQFTSHLALAREALDQEGVPYLYLDGSTPAAARGPLVERFQEGDAPLFLISLKAGGTGLNLTGADSVVHLDPWWNPAVEDQATDRAHRIGQTKPVTVYRLVTRGTIEEAILRLHADKRGLVASVIDGGGGKSGAITTEELVSLLQETASLDVEEDAAPASERSDGARAKRPGSSRSARLAVDRERPIEPIGSIED